MLNNEAMFDQEVFDAPWYVPKDNSTLYIVGPDEIEGPDDEVADELARYCREHEIVMVDCIDLDEFAEGLGLTRVPKALKRWSEGDGYYNA